MEEVKAANTAAVENCHQVVALLSQQQQEDPALLKSIALETGEACAKFRKVAALLGNGDSRGHARGRFSKRGRPAGFLTLKALLGSTRDTPSELMPSTAAAAAPSPLHARISGVPDPRGLDLAGSSSKGGGPRPFGALKLVQPLMDDTATLTSLSWPR